jgi:GH18 family chitinase
VAPYETQAATSPRVGGYFIEWGVYGRQFFVKNVETSGSAAKVGHIYYAFGGVGTGACTAADPWADYQMGYTSANSVDGTNDTGYNWGLADGIAPAQGNFKQLLELKAKHPGLKVLWSFGGFGADFTNAAADPTAFANSCFALLNQPGWAGLFDGIDIDWEYPNACGATCDTSGPLAFANLLSALRTKFGPTALITAAVSAGEPKINATDYYTASQYVDWYNVMTYDFFGTWAATGPTALNAPLSPWPGMPTSAGQDHFYADYALALYVSKGVPASKLNLGIPTYGAGWTGVPNVNGGLNQPATGPATGTWQNGTEDYKVLATSCPPTGVIAGTAEAYCGGNWWTYDTPATVAAKVNHAKSLGLGGVFFWELSGDTSNGVLVASTVQSDLIWQDSNGKPVVWYLNGTTFGGAGDFISYLGSPAGWRIAGSADFNHDGQADLVGQNGASIMFALMSGKTVQSTQSLTPSPGAAWSVRAVADFDGDGQPDIVLQNPDGAVVIWLLNGYSLKSGAMVYGSALPGWTVRGAADFTGDGHPDIVLQHDNGTVVVWPMNGTVREPGIVVSGPLAGWTLRGAADLDGDGQPDLVFTDSASRVVAWLMNGTALKSGASIYSSPVPGWTLRTVR